MTKQILCDFCHEKSNLKQPILMLLADGKSSKYMNNFDINPVNNKLEVNRKSYLVGYEIKFCPVCARKLRG